MDKQNNKNIIKIQRARGYTPLFLALSIILFVLSVYLFVYAYTTNLQNVTKIAFYVAGAIGAIFFAYSTFDNLYQMIQPKNALIFGRKAFADFTVGGVGLGKIEWSNVKSVKTERTQNDKVLIIELFDMDVVLDSAPKSVQKAILNSDWEDNCFVIRQTDITERLSKVEGIILEHITPAKEEPKYSNPSDEREKTKIMSDDNVKKLLDSLNSNENEVELTRTQNIDAIVKSIKTDEKKASQKPDLAKTRAISIDDNLANETLASIFGIEQEPEDEQPEKELFEKTTVFASALEEAPETFSSTQSKEPIEDTKKSEAVDSKGDELDNLLSKFSAELKSGGKVLDDEERDALTNELSAMLDSLKNSKKSEQ